MAPPMGLLLRKGDYTMFQIGKHLPVGIEPRTALMMSSIPIRFISPPRLILVGCWRNAETQKGVHLRECHSHRSWRLTEKKFR